MFHRASAAIEAKIPRSFPRRRNSDDQDAGPDAGSSAKFLSKSAQDGAKQQLGVYRSSTVETLRPPGDQQYTVSFSSDFRDYDLLTPIGYGSSAVVYKGVHRPNRLLVAIKIIDLDMFERRQIDELRRETQIMSLSRHPNVLEVLSAFVQDSKLYLVTPYLAGGSCLDIIKTGFRRGVDEFSIALILKQALKALDYIHRTGHIHRDVKAGNLLIDASGWVKLADFGVSSSLTDTVGSERQGVRLTFVGTPCWMAPEVIEEKAYDAKADIWSFGITALELATGEAPLANLPALKVLMTTLSKPPPALDRGNSQYKYSKSFEDLISQCLQKDPRQRPTAQGLLQHTFFRKARKTHHYGHLVTHLLQRVPVLEQRPH
ncbi:kinase-like domain-containing protein, partial [Dimargaris cristalligena]